MSKAEAQEERLTDYERAICYSTIPRVTHPLAYGLIVAYAMVVLLTLAFMVYGLRSEGSSWERWGTTVFGLTVAVGVVGFTLRAIVNQVYERSALAEAETMPNVESGFDDLPDPFEGNTLLRFRQYHEGDTLDVTDNRGRTVYTAVKSDQGRHWEVRQETDDVPMIISAQKGARSFDFGMGDPSQFVVEREGVETASLRRRFSLRTVVIEISGQKDGEKDCVFRAGGFYRGKDLLGRIFFIRNYAYLDIRKTALSDGVLALFIAMIS